MLHNFIELKKVSVYYALLFKEDDKWVKVFKNGQPLKNLKWNSVPKQTISL